MTTNNHTLTLEQCRKVAEFVGWKRNKRDPQLYPHIDHPSYHWDCSPIGYCEEIWLQKKIHSDSFLPILLRGLGGKGVFGGYTQVQRKYGWVGLQLTGFYRTVTTPSASTPSYSA